MVIYYDRFNKEYMKIYKYLFRSYLLEDVGYEWTYLENELYALRPVGGVEFVIVSARSPRKAYDKLQILARGKKNV